MYNLNAFYIICRKISHIRLLVCAIVPDFFCRQIYNFIKFCYLAFPIWITFWHGKSTRSGSPSTFWLWFALAAANGVKCCAARRHGAQQPQRAVTVTLRRKPNGKKARRVGSANPPLSCRSPNAAHRSDVPPGVQPRAAPAPPMRRGRFTPTLGSGAALVSPLWRRIRPPGWRISKGGFLSSEKVKILSFRYVSIC